MKDKTPFVSFLIPTLNSEKVLSKCLASISQQSYPKGRVEIIVADGGSTDKTVEIAQKHRSKIYFNKLKTGEAGKAVALKEARGELVALVDSDNILPDKNWLGKIIEPFKDNQILGAEPWKFSFSKNDTLINRYCALLGANDPYAHFLGVYDKYSYLSGRWTGLNLEVEDKKSYLKVKMKAGYLPTVGANGTVWRKKVLEGAVGESNYLFDTDIPYLLAENGPFYYAKVKVDIRHLYCQNTGDFHRKQKRRVKDFYYLEGEKKRGSTYQRQTGRQFAFALQTLLLLPLVYQSLKGYLNKRDQAWFFHPLASLITLWTYGTETFLAWFRKEQMERGKWRQSG